MPESYTPSEFIDKVNSQSPNGVKFDPYNTQSLREELLSRSNSESEDNTTPEQRLLTNTKQELQQEQELLAKAEAELEAMKQWLLSDDTYTPQEIDEIMSKLTVRYDKDKQEAIVDGNLDLRSLTSAEGLELPQSITNIWNQPYFLFELTII